MMKRSGSIGTSGTEGNSFKSRNPGESASSSLAQAKHDLATGSRKFTTATKRAAKKSKTESAEESSSRQHTRALGNFAKEKDVTGAVEWYKTIREKFQLTSNQFSVLVSLVSRDATYNTELMRIFSDIEKANKFNEPSASLMVRAFADNDEPQNGLIKLQRMRELGFEPRLRTFAPLLSSFTRAVTKFNKTSKGDFMSIKDLYLDMKQSMADAKKLIPLEDFQHMMEAVILLKEKNQNDVEYISQLTNFYNLILCDAANSSFLATAELQKLVKTWYTSKNGWSVVEKASVNARGVCSGCGQSLHSVELNESDKEMIKKKTNEMVARVGTRSKSANRRWVEFKQALNTRKQKLGDGGAYDIVIDAANVAYFYQVARLGFNYEFLIAVVDKLDSLNLRWIMCLHEKHLGPKDIRTPHHKEVVQKWRDEGNLYIVPRGHNDDWYWLYAALFRGGRTLVLSNDLMRDHNFMLLRNRTFQTWRERHQVFFEAFQVSYRKRTNTNVNFIFPTSTSKNMQIESFQDEVTGKVSVTSNGGRIREGPYTPDGELKSVHIPVNIARELKGDSRESRPYIRDVPLQRDLEWLCCSNVKHLNAKSEVAQNSVGAKN